ncbi:MAG: hypothetical protein A2V81_01625 [Candidatus Abawacabacteria bacterium RBG_16_42_10]|uniref:Uncharacterized protein n=1 Tax=Candidatus Abawacabacteria bacterium RBG_16_42_10 TaxID=1817814 RepID=A0A1F4XKN0_9BACT|nr:MAG: hypothetical protein A2V81_01625 [Candidatus Abawacabacteria bacterium RBG_16_42_10]
MEKRICTQTNVPFTITDDEIAYLEERKLPLPTVSPMWRLRELFANRNEFNLFERTCSKSSKKIISCYRTDAEFPVYDYDIWISDQYDPFTYGRDYDFSRPFFEQYRDLWKVVPRPSRVAIGLEGSPYVNAVMNIKNSHYIFVSYEDQDSFYSYRLYRSRDCMDCIEVDESELCYECIDCTKCYNVKWAYHTHNSSDSAFLYLCRGCTNCFGCVGLKQKSYCIWNVEYTKEEYEQKMKAMNLSSRKNLEQLQQKFWKFVKESGVVFDSIVQSENCTGAYIEHSVNCKDSYFLKNCNHVLNCHTIHGGRDCYSSRGAINGELLYYSAGVARNSYNTQFCFNATMLIDSMYCNGILGGGNHLFGCIGFSKKNSYCILNKQYTQKEYEELLPRILKHMESTGELGKFFPLKYAEFPYIDSPAQVDFPMTDEEAEKWDVYVLKQKAFTTTDKKVEIPDTIDQVDESICDQILQDQETHRAYKLQKKELEFYKKMNIPVPVYSFETRNLKRSKILFQFNKTP